MRLGRAWLAAPALVAALLVAVAGPASATGEEGEVPMVVSADRSGSLGPEAEQPGERFRLVRARQWPERPVSEANKSGSGTAATRRSPTDPRLLAVGTAQSDTETTPESDTEITPESDTERRLVGRQSSERVDAVVIALWSIAAGMAVMLVVFLWHTSPRRRLRLARRRSTQLYDGEADLAAAAAGAGSADDAEVVEDAAAAAADAREDVAAVAVAASGADEAAQPAAEALRTTWEDPAPVEEDSGPAGPVVSTAWEDPEVADPELPPVWEDDDEPAGEDAEPADGSPSNELPEAQKAADEGRSGLWMRLRRTLGLD